MLHPPTSHTFLMSEINKGGLDHVRRPVLVEEGTCRIGVPAYLTQIQS